MAATIQPLAVAAARAGLTQALGRSHETQRSSGNQRLSLEPLPPDRISFLKAALRSGLHADTLIQHIAGRVSLRQTRTGQVFSHRPQARSPHPAVRHAPASV